MMLTSGAGGPTCASDEIKTEDENRRICWDEKKKKRDLLTVLGDSGSAAGGAASAASAASAGSAGSSCMKMAGKTWRLRCGPKDPNQKFGVALVHVLPDVVMRI